MKIRYTIDILNPKFFDSVVMSKSESFQCSALSYRVLSFKICPRIGESIAYPLFDLLDEGIRTWLHNHVSLEVTDVLHNPESIESVIDGVVEVKPLNEFDVLLRVKAKNIHPLAR